MSSITGASQSEMLSVYSTVPNDWADMSLRNSKSPHVSWSIQSILDDLNNIAVWRVAILTLIFDSSLLFFNPLEDRSRRIDFYW